jgi:hypothetical protein
MRCNEGNCYNGPNSIMCRNKGMSDDNIVWECTGHGLVPGYVMRGATVSCEGYTDSLDPYILRGSCAVFYRIEKDYNYQGMNDATTTTTTTTSTYYPYNDLYTYDIIPASFAYIILVLIVVYCFVLLTGANVNMLFVDREPPPPNYVPNYAWYNPMSWTGSWTYAQPYPRRYGGYYNPPSYASTGTGYVQSTTTTTTVNRSSTGSGGNSRDPTTSTTYANTVNR